MNKDCRRSASIVAAAHMCVCILNRKRYQELSRMTVRHDMEEKANFFRSLLLFRDWNRRRLTTMMYAAQPRTFSTRTHLFRAGEPTDGLYFIRAGYCKVSDSQRSRQHNHASTTAAHFSTSKQIELAVVGPGSLVGDLDLVAAVGEGASVGPRSLSVQATETVHAYYFSLADVDAFFQRDVRTWDMIAREAGRKAAMFEGRRASLLSAEQANAPPVIEGRRRSFVGSLASNSPVPSPHGANFGGEEYPSSPQTLPYSPLPMAQDSPGPSHPHLTTSSVGPVAGTTTTTTTTAAPSTAATRRDVAVATLPAPHSGPLERFGEVRQRSSLGHALSPWPTDSRAGAVSGLGEDRAGARGSALQAGAGVLPGGLPALGGQRPKAGRTSNAGKEVLGRFRHADGDVVLMRPEESGRVSHSGASARRGSSTARGRAPTVVDLGAAAPPSTARSSRGSAGGWVPGSGIGGGGGSVGGGVGAASPGVHAGWVGGGVSVLGLDRAVTTEPASMDECDAVMNAIALDLETARYQRQWQSEKARYRRPMVQHTGPLLMAPGGAPMPVQPYSGGVDRLPPSRRPSTAAAEGEAGTAAPAGGSDDPVPAPALAPALAPAPASAPAPSGPSTLGGADPLDPDPGAALDGVDPGVGGDVASDAAGSAAAARTGASSAAGDMGGAGEGGPQQPVFVHLSGPSRAGGHRTVRASASPRVAMMQVAGVFRVVDGSTTTEVVPRRPDMFVPRTAISAAHMKPFVKGPRSGRALPSPGEAGPPAASRPQNERVVTKRVLAGGACSYHR